MNKPLTVLISLMVSLTFFPLLSGCFNQTTKNTEADNTHHDTLSQTGRQINKISIQKGNLTVIYSKAIGDYIRLAKKDYHITFDTLFFGKHVYGQPDDFPDIELPETIEHTHTRLITPEQGAKKQKENKSLVYINMVGWVDSANAEFIFVTFSNGGAHQFDCYINYKYNAAISNFEFLNSRFENYLYKQK